MHYDMYIGFMITSLLCNLNVDCFDEKMALHIRWLTYLWNMLLFIV